MSANIPNFDHDFTVNPAAITIDHIVSSGDDYLLLHDAVVEAAHTLHSVTPDTITTQYGGIDLLGSVPYAIARYIRGNDFRSASFTRQTMPAVTTDDKLSLVLHGSSPLMQTTLSTMDKPAQNGHEKIFSATPHGLSEPLGYLACSDVCWLLDELTLDPISQFSALADLRSGASFTDIAIGMQALLAEQAKTKTTTQIYTTQPHNSDFLGNQTQVSLTYKQEADLSECTLEVTSPLEIGEGHVNKTFRYMFTDQTESIISEDAHRTLTYRTFAPDSQLVVWSDDLSGTQLHRLAGNEENLRYEANPLYIAERGLELLVRAKSIQPK